VSKVELLLGPIAFQDFEVPASINIGGAQRLAIHRLLGGTRVIDALGRDDSDISFSGTFSGSDASERARSIDEMRVAGVPMPLTWDAFSYSVIINKFEANYRSGWWIPYHLSCTVVCDDASGTIATATSLGSDALSDVTTACIFATAAGLDLTEAQSAVAMPDAAVKGTATYASTVIALASANAIIGIEMSQAEACLEAASWSPDSLGLTAAVALNGMVSAAQQISALTVAQAYIGRAAINVTNAST
jgi:hypothetical protein